MTENTDREEGDETEEGCIVAGMHAELLGWSAAAAAADMLHLFLFAKVVRKQFGSKQFQLRQGSILSSPMRFPSADALAGLPRSPALSRRAERDTVTARVVCEGTPRTAPGSRSGKGGAM